MRTPLPYVLAALAVLLVAAAPASAAKKKLIYVSVGDSLAWSYTKSAEGQPAQTDKGYVELLAAKARTDRRYGKNLAVKKFGCPGESTVTYRNGGRCDFGSAKSQAAAANAFIKKNRKRIAFITVSIGANNFTPCLPGGQLDVACIQKGNADLDRDLPAIYRSLRKAAGSQAKIVTHTQYNPYLALYLRGGDYQQLAVLTNDQAKFINAKIASAAKHRRARLRVADVFKAFKAGSLTKQVNGVPEAVGAVCSLTLMCRPAPVGPDIHPSDAGYSTMATTFAKALQIK